MNITNCSIAEKSFVEACKWIRCVFHRKPDLFHNNVFEILGYSKINSKYKSEEINGFNFVIEMFTEIIMQKLEKRTQELEKTMGPKVRRKRFQDELLEIIIEQVMDPLRKEIKKRSLYDYDMDLPTEKSMRDKSRTADQISKEDKDLTEELSKNSIDHIKKLITHDSKAESKKRSRRNKKKPLIINDYEIQSETNLSNKPLKQVIQDDDSRQLYRHCQTVLTENDMKFIDLWYQGIDKARDQAEILGININVAYEERRKIKSILKRTLPNNLK